MKVDHPLSFVKRWEVFEQKWISRLSCSFPLEPFSPSVWEVMKCVRDVAFLTQLKQSQRHRSSRERTWLDESSAHTGILVEGPPGCGAVDFAWLLASTCGKGEQSNFPVLVDLDAFLIGKQPLLRNSENREAVVQSLESVLDGVITPSFLKRGHADTTICPTFVIFRHLSSVLNSQYRDASGIAVSSVIIELISAYTHRWAISNAPVVSLFPCIWSGAEMRRGGCALPQGLMTLVGGVSDRVRLPTALSTAHRHCILKFIAGKRNNSISVGEDSLGHAAELTIGFLIEDLEALVSTWTEIEMDAAPVAPPLNRSDGWPLVLSTLSLIKAHQSSCPASSLTSSSMAEGSIPTWAITAHKQLGSEGENGRMLSPLKTDGITRKTSRKTGLSAMVALHNLVTELEVDVVEPIKMYLRPGLMQSVFSKHLIANDDVVFGTRADWLMTAPTPIMSGVLLTGSPGSGKTFIAQCLAEEIGLALRPVNCGDVLGPVVGSSERAIVSLFDAAMQSNTQWGSVILLENVEMLAPKQLGVCEGQNDGPTIERPSDVISRVSSTLLSQMDRIHSNNQAAERSAPGTFRIFIVIATTEDHNRVDCRLIQPHRIGKVYDIDQHLKETPPLNRACCLLEHYLIGRVSEQSEESRLKRLVYS
eukprot:GHVN01003234.1.p1 GENE.GHVN01003234.1~~GHVN01003234.1.p1  ORF type:complete len:647 (+),score=73.46 GHVN01003234.1:963-2903(+)